MLIVKVTQDDPLDSPSKKNLPGGQQDQGHGVLLYVQTLYGIIIASGYIILCKSSKGKTLSTVSLVLTLLHKIVSKILLNE